MRLTPCCKKAVGGEPLFPLKGIVKSAFHTESNYSTGNQKMPHTIAIRSILSRISIAELLAQKTNQDMLTEKKQLEAELQKAIARNETVLKMYEKVYEDNASGKVTDEFFMQLSHKYEVERMDLKTKIAAMRKKLSDLGTQELGREAFIAAVRKFLQMETLTAPLLRELIDHIDVYETEGTGRNRTQRVVIHYRFVGYLELPENVFRQSYKADTRQGVSVEYLRDPATA